jgi:hypothetical protein
VFRKPENPKLAVKHLVILFVCDLIQGIIEARLSATNHHLEITILDELLRMSLTFLEGIHNNPFELIENYLQAVRFSTQRDITIERKYQRFQPDMLYNPVAMNYLVWSHLFQEKTEKYKYHLSKSQQLAHLHS